MTVLAVDNQTDNMICLTEYILDKSSCLVGGRVGSLLRLYAKNGWRKSYVQAKIYDLIY